MNHFTLKIDHKPLEWLATVSDANGKRGRWIDMLQDFSFKILHRPGLKHGNVDALSKNPVGQATDDNDFNEEIHDVETVQTNARVSRDGVLCSVWEDFRLVGFQETCK